MKHNNNYTPAFNMLRIVLLFLCIPHNKYTGRCYTAICF